MIDVDARFTSILIKWAYKMILVEEGNWKLFCNHFLSKFGDDGLIFRMNLDFKCLKHLLKGKNVPLFYVNVFKAWISYTECDTVNNTIQNVRSQVIWGNQLILNLGKPIFLSNWVKSNIITVNDLLNNENVLNFDDVRTKLISKRNWMSEISIVKSSIPTTFKDVLLSENSIKSKIKVMKYKYDMSRG